MELIAFLLILFFLPGFICPSMAQTGKKSSEAEQAEVALMGVFHFAGSTGDAAAIQLDNMLGERRQREISEILDHLEKYKPDKILVEYPSKKQAALTQSYQQYLQDDKTLDENEIHQLGFKLGRRLNHEKLYAIDYKLNLPFGELRQYAQAHGKEQYLEDFIGHVKSYAREKEAYLKEHTLLDYLRGLNTDTSDLWHKNLYLEALLTMGTDTLYPGARMAGDYYKRNAYILSNIDRVTAPGDRVLVIVGSGHRAFLKPMVREKRDFQYVEIHPYLE